MRKACGIFFLAIAGLFLNTLCIFGSIDIDGRSRAAMLVVFAVPALVTMLIGITCMGWRRWRHDTGVLFLAVAAFAAFTFVSMTCFLMDESFRAMMGDVPTDVFGITVTGCVYVAIFGALGWLLYRKAPVRDTL
ncbi:MAG: hypothetical protein ABW069_08320 [Duganella sp.]